MPGPAQALHEFILSECGGWLSVGALGRFYDAYPEQMIPIRQCGGIKSLALQSDGLLIWERDGIAVVQHRQSSRTHPVWHNLPREVKGLFDRCGNVGVFTDASLHMFIRTATIAVVWMNMSSPHDAVGMRVAIYLGNRPSITATTVETIAMVAAMVVTQVANLQMPRREIIFHTDSQGVFHRWTTNLHGKSAGGIDGRWWRRLEQMPGGKKRLVQWVKSHPERRYASCEEWTREEHGNWAADQLAETGELAEDGGKLFKFDMPYKEAARVLNA